MWVNAGMISACIASDNVGDLEKAVSKSARVRERFLAVYIIAMSSKFCPSSVASFSARINACFRFIASSLLSFKEIDGSSQMRDSNWAYAVSFKYEDRNARVAGVSRFGGGKAIVLARPA